ncbi:hypothetical protein ACVWYG_003422 [Pedobacter sp. UYEF25]
MPITSLLLCHLASSGLAAVWRKKRLKLLALTARAYPTEEDLHPCIGRERRQRHQRLDVNQLGEFLPKGVQALIFCKLFYQEKSLKPVRQAQHKEEWWPINAKRMYC